MVNCIILPKFIHNWYILTQLCSHWQSLFYLCQLSIERLWYMQTAIGVDRYTLRTNGLSNLCIEKHSYTIVCNKWYNWSILHQQINSCLSQFVLSPNTYYCGIVLRLFLTVKAVLSVISVNRSTDIYINNIPYKYTQAYLTMVQPVL